MKQKRKCKNGEQTFISWQVEIWRRVIDAQIVQEKQDWAKTDAGDKTVNIVLIIPLMLITVWTLCGLLPSALINISLAYSCLAFVGIYAVILLWFAKHWLNGRYDEYIEDMETDNE